jgi:periplasmic protein TonB
VVGIAIFIYLDVLSTPRFSGRTTQGAGMRVTLMAAQKAPSNPSPQQVHLSTEHHLPVHQRTVLATQHQSLRAVTQVSASSNVPVLKPTSNAAPPNQPVASTATPAKSDASTGDTASRSDLPLTGAQAAPDIAHVVCHFEQPSYPPHSRYLGNEGTVVLRVMIDETGRVVQADIAKSSGFDDLDAAARATLLAGHCEPHIGATGPMTVHAMQPLTFKLGD